MAFKGTRFYFDPATRQVEMVYENCLPGDDWPEQQGWEYREIEETGTVTTDMLYVGDTDGVPEFQPNENPRFADRRAALAAKNAVRAEIRAAEFVTQWEERLKSRTLTELNQLWNGATNAQKDEFLKYLMVKEALALKYQDE